jgi:hypothetical protein
MFVLVFVLSSMILFAPAAFGENARVGTSTVAFVPPAGYCEFQSGQPGDARMLQAIRGMIEPIGNTLLSASAECGQLKDWRSGARKLISDMTQYQTVTAWMEKDLSEGADTLVKNTCATLRTEGEKIASNMLPDVKARAAEVIKGMKVNEMRFLGVVDENPGVCYAALLQKFQAQTGEDVTQLGVYATLVVKGKIVYFYQFSPYAGPDSVPAVLAKHKNSVAAFIAINKN